MQNDVENFKDKRAVKKIKQENDRVTEFIAVNSKKLKNPVDEGSNKFIKGKA